MTKPLFEDIRPYNIDEVPAAIKRMMSHEHFHAATDYLFSEEEKTIIFENLKKVQSNFEFQMAYMYKVIQRILENSSDGLSVENSEIIKDNGPSLFVSNHRDILLDSAILQLVLVNLGMETSEITFGSNLMVNDLIIDFGKTNRMFTVYREGSPREMLENSKRLSAYIHHTLKDKEISAWIAQRKGRTKDGNDKTDSVVLKMLTTFDRKNPLKAYKEINILPVIISYEWEPCDLLKIRELYLSKLGTYKKQDGEDMRSVLNGITEYKGKISMSFGKAVNGFLDEQGEDLDKNNIHLRVAQFIDEQVYMNYQLFPNNYWAYDRLNNTTTYSDHYNSDVGTKMIERLEKLFQLMQTRDQELEKMFLELYAMPLHNKLPYL